MSQALRLSAPLFRGPLDPKLVLVIAVLLPGFGHVVSGQARRGFTMQMFMVCLSFVTWNLTTPQHSLLGRLAGGLFVYALSIPEAYRIARIRYAVARAGEAG
jgi:hypothetical protein